jgi:Uma2 family endonuclease
MEVCQTLLFRLTAEVKEMLKAHPEAKVGRVHMEMGYLIPGDPPTWLRPDVSITHPDQPIDRYYLGAPLIVFEVVSEYDTARQIADKVAMFLAHGAKEVWVIYPEARCAWLYDGSGTAREMRSIVSALLPGVEIALNEIL